MKSVLIIILLLFAFTACSQNTSCNSPYIQVGASCCLDKNGNNICDSDDEQRQERNNPAPAVAPSTAVSPTDLYSTYADSVYYVKTECVYDYQYPDFFLRSSVSGQWGVLIDLAMRKNDTITRDGDENSHWIMNSRRNSTKQYGTAFAAGNVLYTNQHVVQCPFTNVDIVDYFDLIDLSGKDVNAESTKIYDKQAGFEELRTSKDLIAIAVNRTVAEHYRSKANFTLYKREITLYHQSSNFTHPIVATVIANGSKFPDTDYAVLTMNDKTHSVKTAPTTDPIIGSQVYLLGFPWIIHFQKPGEHSGMETNMPIITQGIISNRILSDTNVTYFVVDAAATFGSSGSPVFDNKGEVIGIITAGQGGINLLLPLAALPAK